MVEEWKYCEELKPKPKGKWTFANKPKEAQKHQTEWCAAANKYRCIGCGKKKQKHEDARIFCKTNMVDGTPKHKLRRWGQLHVGGHDMVRRVGRNREVLICDKECDTVGELLSAS